MYCFVVTPIAKYSLSPTPNRITQVHPLYNHPPPAERLISSVEMEAYLAKLQELQQYVPSLVRALNQLSRGRMEDRGRESVRKLQFILHVLQDKTTRLGRGRCMGNGMYSKYQYLLLACSQRVYVITYDL